MKYKSEEERKEAKRISNKKYYVANIDKEKERSRIKYETNKEKIKTQHKTWVKLNPEKKKEIDTRYIEKNKVKLNKKNREYNKRYRNENPEKAREYDRLYREKNKEKTKIKNNLSYIKYCNKHPEKVVWRAILKSCHKRMGTKKEEHTIDELGYSALDLKNDMISKFTDGMSWDNYGEWHIDHIKRVREFSPDISPRIINALSNLRPLWATSRTINGVFYEGNLNRG